MTCARPLSVRRIRKRSRPDSGLANSRPASPRTEILAAEDPTRYAPGSAHFLRETGTPAGEIGNLPISNVSFQTRQRVLRVGPAFACRPSPNGNTPPVEEPPRAHYARLDEIAWFARNSGKQKPDIPAILKEGPNLLLRRLEIENGASPKPGGLKQPNAYGLFDMLGNVREWTAGEWTGGSTADDPNSEDSSSTGKQRVIRGEQFLDACVPRSRLEPRPYGRNRT